jgi:hypothetical protein
MHECESRRQPPRRDLAMTELAGNMEVNALLQWKTRVFIPEPR